MVSLMKEHVGRGPETSRAHINEGVVTVLLEGTLTEVERTLVRAGKQDVVKNTRQSYQDALCDDAIALVEEQTGSEVRAFMSDHSVEPDVAILCFVLATSGERDAGEPAPCPA